MELRLPQWLATLGGQGALANAAAACEQHRRALRDVEVLEARFAAMAALASTPDVNPTAA